MKIGKVILLTTLFIMLVSPLMGSAETTMKNDTYKIDVNPKNSHLFGHDTYLKIYLWDTSIMLRLIVPSRVAEEGGEFIFDLRDKEVEGLLFTGENLGRHYHEMPIPRDVNGNLPSLPYKNMAALSGEVIISGISGKTEKMYGRTVRVETKNVVFSNGVGLHDISVSLIYEVPPP
jgi:hypothetical protein